MRHSDWPRSFGLWLYIHLAWRWIKHFRAWLLSHVTFAIQASKHGGIWWMKFSFIRKKSRQKMATKAFEPKIFLRNGSQDIRIGAKDGGFGDRTRPQETQWQINWQKITQFSSEQSYLTHLKRSYTIVQMFLRSSRTFERSRGDPCNVISKSLGFKLLSYLSFPRTLFSRKMNVVCL